ncbi:MAG: DUF881 domain-containing protein [Actinomycetota bacterium]|jgi:uncharacterized protein YlxW (UPF0749 family)|nr:DUF881 domain-containing protein [Actinomycetota bacterium]
MSSEDRAAPRLPTRAASVVALGLVATILTVAARSEDVPTVGRTGRRLELVELIRAEERRTAQLEQRVAELDSQVDGYEAAGVTGTKAVARLQRRIDRIRVPAGMTGLAGPGLAVTLDDSTLPEAPDGDLNNLVIHEQDLQAVINALWAGGAEAMDVNGQRILATTAIRCAGNTLLLHGSVYSPPYVIRAVGDDVALRAALDRDPVVASFHAAVRQYQLGFSVVSDRSVSLPAYFGPPTVDLAQPASEQRS